MIKEIIEKIKEYQEIVIYRHVNPDYDAFGSQFGMYDLIKSNFNDKKVYLAGDFSSDLVSKFRFDVDQKLPDFNQSVLGIVLDTANHERIDGESYQQCQELIKIDHHIVVDQYGIINFEDPQASSCSQLVGLMLQEQYHLNISKLGARAIYMGIIGDTNRFMYNSTSDETFNVASLLMTKGINIEEIYNAMYLKNAKDIEINRFIYNHQVVDGRISYYVLKDEDLKELDIPRSRGSDFVNIFSGYKEYLVWMAITENVEDHNWRVSIRSRGVKINEIANKYHGGGHAFASGATLQSLDELQSLIVDLKEAIHETENL
ncbi:MULTISPECIES: bifunctional oligoribonuclease/PAP phosphatase NrnA [Coprobacillaceae]|uniref:DHH family phosphoesterase n=1 Tax=Coprobacillaceae TaxID=2810280 RepID=UPI000E4FB5ED|nr:MULTISPECIES: bifunctional oligoribonuclease/PAP phosphatase NrnA [Coprobacillaceae]RHM62572.1 bifunctional oligoribonuclease/PAP phosphatase NrnA [Coprobacillus sp. AF33-1AC]RHS93390.1 bifunctional oligoribonuclease/PAP phosphatase NrnA [Erysipelatoclostridium sp. AM42-17]